ncbi:efflux RND transporter periplasmic adaptor subunit [Gammaproteobacteria bacterium AS21]
MTVRASRSTVQPKADVSASALKLLQFEADIRRCVKKEELIFHLANQLNRLIPYEQVFVFTKKTPQKCYVVAASDLSQIENSSPLIQLLNKWASTTAPSDISQTYRLDDIFRESIDFPYNNAYWLPIQSETAQAINFLLLFSNKSYTEQQQALLNRLSATYEHAFRAASAKKQPASSRRSGFLLLKIVLLITFFVVCAFPFPISVMAPVEVTSKEPFIVTAPFSGVIKKILIPPNTKVEQGQILATFEDIQLRNEYLIEQQRLAVAKANFEKVQGAAFANSESAHELGIARAEFSLALVEARYTREQLSRTKIRSPNAGLVIYNDKEGLEGKSVQVGERILQVAQVDKISYRIDLPVGQAIAFKDGARITIYLDSAPLGGHQAKLNSASYLPKVAADGIASYTLLALPTEGSIPKIGARGTARVYGDNAPLIWHFLRRPVNAVRQWLGV